MSEDVAPLTHVDAAGAARMVDVGHKESTFREAVARASVRMRQDTLASIRDNTARKGDVLAVARVAGIMAAKRTSELIPLCHSLSLSSAAVDFQLDESEGAVHVVGTARTQGQTGVEMEALVAVSVAALTIYDMCKAADRAISIDNVHLVSKTGGKSGTYVAR